ncbi:1-acyl-sn-glycerol-3-phosphate acyltransferase [Actinomycetospora sp. TBRC 11914]|uniref:lysophospholipid acyltransferase family protein n=1 Tax=Actinomycetospora sp. TBRC 11914 TaxID=2729387 RepID=UPI00145C903D|nr:lysophospholipid acyltransferase family protein [Actinomycetospora sp. TBRC 11914]NMO89283.1 1-acyl-sn-glycerol-3-phosphate acyltransferase [Actinomycetospora sp. TBRC 11914]
MTGWFPTSPCGPECLPVAAPDAGVVRLGRVVRTTLRLAALAGAVAAGAILAPAAPVLGLRRLERAQAIWCGMLLAAAGVRVVVTGPRPAPGSLVVANHVSWLDVLALNQLVPVRMLAKAELRTWPLIGPMAARAGTVFLDRDRLRALPDAVAAVTGALGAGGCVGVFPEGTTRCGRDLARFRPAAFQAALDAGAPVVPVALSYADADGGPDAAPAFVGDDTLVASLVRVAAARGTVLTVRVLPVQAPVRDDDGPRARGRRDAARRAAAAITGALPAPADDPRPRPAVHPVPVPTAAVGALVPLAGVEVDRVA